MSEAERPSLRAYLRDIEPRPQLPQEMGHGVILRAAGDAPALPGPEDLVNRAATGHVMDAQGVDQEVGIEHIHCALTAIRVASDCSVALAGYSTGDGKFIQGEEGAFPLWGHHTPELSSVDVAFAQAHFGTFLDYLRRERYSRVANALRLHTSGLVTRDPDLALLGFVGAIESLFSVAPQELSFRLSLAMARFLGDTQGEQRDYYGRARKLYEIRSKIAHGDKIAKTEEAAAIEIVDFWTPEAAELARLSIRRVFGLGLTSVFDSPKQHERFLTELLFAGTADDAVEGVREVE